jgi:hypothetical protein
VRVRRRHLWGTVCAAAAAAAVLSAAAAAPGHATTKRGSATSATLRQPLEGRVHIGVIVYPDRKPPLRNFVPPRLRIRAHYPRAFSEALIIALDPPPRGRNYVALVALVRYRVGPWMPADPYATPLLDLGSTRPFRSIFRGDPLLSTRPPPPIRALLTGKEWTIDLLQLPPATVAPAYRDGQTLLREVIRLAIGERDPSFLRALNGQTPVPPVRDPVGPAGPPPALLSQNTSDVDAGLVALADANGIPACFTSGAGGDARRAAVIHEGGGLHPLLDATPEQILQQMEGALSAPTGCLILQGFEQGYGDPVTGTVDVAGASPAGRLLLAMQEAQSRLLPDGSTLAQRVVLDIGPTIPAAIGAGAGPDHDRGADGKSRYRTFRTLLSAGARSRGVYLQMFHGTNQPFKAQEWLLVPSALLDVFTGVGGDPQLLHFDLAAVNAMPEGLPPGFAGDPMQAQFRLARQPGAAARIFANGVGAANLGADAAAFLRELSAGYSGL